MVREQIRRCEVDDSGGDARHSLCAPVLADFGSAVSFLSPMLDHESGKNSEACPEEPKGLRDRCSSQGGPGGPGAVRYVLAELGLGDSLDLEHLSVRGYIPGSHRLLKG